MRIGLLTTSFPRWEGDVAGSFVLGFARTLVGRGHEVEVLAPEPAETIALPRWPGIELRWVPYLRPRVLERTFYGAGVPDNLRRDPRAWLGLVPFSASLAREARRAATRWDAIVSHWALPCALAAGATRTGRPHLAVIHSADLHLLTKLPGSRALARRIARGASALLFMTTDQRARFLELLPHVERASAAGRCHVSPMGVEAPPETGATRRALRSALDLDRFTALTLSRLVPVKGLEDAVHAVAGREDLLLLVAGDGPERRRLEELADRLRAPVRFVGEVTGRHKGDLLRACDAFLSTSRRLPSGRTEGVPTAILEAMVAGLPVLATNVGGVATIVEHDRSGLLVEPDRPDALAAALDRLRADRNLRRRLGRAAERQGRRFLWSELGPHLEALVVGEPEAEARDERSARRPAG